MPTYIGLYKYTDQGIKNVKDSPDRVQDAIKAAESMGAKVMGVYSVMGEYDLVTIGEFILGECLQGCTSDISTGTRR